MKDPFAVPDAAGDAAVRELIAEYPLAWVTAGDAAGLLPLVGRYEDGRLVALVGHLARANPLFAALSATPRANILFAGPQGYISPEQAGQDDWAPTWNYAQATIAADICFDDALTEVSLDAIIAPMEAGRAEPWRKERLSARYAGMLRAIIGFEATVTRVDARFKLGQDERPETLRRILDRHPDPALVRWMRRMNAARLEEAG